MGGGVVGGGVVGGGVVGGGVVGPGVTPPAALPPLQVYAPVVAVLPAPTVRLVPLENVTVIGDAVGFDAT